MQSVQSVAADQAIDVTREGSPKPAENQAQDGLVTDERPSDAKMGGEVPQQTL